MLLHHSVRIKHEHTQKNAPDTAESLRDLAMIGNQGLNHCYTYI